MRSEHKNIYFATVSGSSPARRHPQCFLAHLSRVAHEEHEYDPEERPGDALVPLEPGLDAAVRVQRQGGLEI